MSVKRHKRAEHSLRRQIVVPPTRVIVASSIPPAGRCTRIAHERIERRASARDFFLTGERDASAAVRVLQDRGARTSAAVLG